MLKVLNSWLGFIKALDRLKVVKYAEYNIWCNKARKRAKNIALEAGINIDIGQVRKPTFEDCRYDD